MCERANLKGMLKLPIALVWLVAVVESSLLVPRYTNNSCSADCSAFDVLGRCYWQKQEVTSTVTAATVVYIVNDRTNTTRTETKYNSLPGDITTPPTNPQGTHVTTLTIETAKGKSSEVVIPYPHDFTMYPLSYGWYGTLPTIDAMGQSVCSTVDREKTTQFVDYSAYATPAQTGVDTIDPNDPKGWVYSLMCYGCYEQPDSTINPNDAAPTACKPLALCGVSALSTVQFLTDTSVSHEDNAADTTPTPTPADSTPAAAQQAKQTPPPAASPAGGNNNAQQQQTPTPAPASAPAPAQAPAPATIVVGSQTVTANAQSNFVVAGQTLSQGGQIVAGDTTVSLAKGGSIAVVNGATQSLVAAQPAASPVLTIDGQTVTANSAGQFVVGGSTLGVGSAITLGSGASKTTVSLTTNSLGQTVAVVNGKSSTLSAGKTGSGGGVGGAVASGIGVQQFTGAGVKFRIGWSAAMTPLFARLFWALL